MKRPPLIHDELILGIDEAGRGPILGPMVMACVALRPRKAALLTRAGVADSKQFAGPDAHAARTALVPRILDAADHIEIVVVDVADIDRACRYNGLNRLEQVRAAALIAAAPACRRIVCDGARLFGPLRALHANLDARDRAESAHAAVAAASIVAKVRRDELWGKIARRYAADFGDLVVRGGGYTNAATHAFLRAYATRHRSLPPEARRSWPWSFAADLLPPTYDPWADVADDRPQLDLFGATSTSTPAPAPAEPPAPRNPATTPRSCPTPTPSPS